MLSIKQGVLCYVKDEAQVTLQLSFIQGILTDSYRSNGKQMKRHKQWKSKGMWSQFLEDNNILRVSKNLCQTTAKISIQLLARLCSLSKVAENQY